MIQKEIERVAGVKIGANKEVQALLESYGSIPLNTGTTLTELIRRPELDYEKLAPIDKERPELTLSKGTASKREVNDQYQV